MYWLLAFCICFLNQFHNIYIANIIFCIWFMVVEFTKRKVVLVNKPGLVIMCIFLFWSFFSMTLFAIQYGNVSGRNIYQNVYNIQYIFLCLDGFVDKNKLKKCIQTVSHILACAIIVLWITKTGMRDIAFLQANDRMWADSYFNGWPNSTVLPLLFGLYLDLKHNIKEKLFSILRISILLFAILLCTSRTGILGAAFIFSFYFLRGKDGKRDNYVKIKTIFGMVCIVAGAALAIYFISSSDLSTRMFTIVDRLDIVQATMDFVSKRPFVGYGGNSFDVAYVVAKSSVAKINFGHTHNTILEILLRYGIIGLLLFVTYLLTIFRKIKGKDEKVVFLVFWILSLFQIYVRDFVFLLFIFLLLPNIKFIYGKKDEDHTINCVE